MPEKYKGPINIPCSACSAGDDAMEFHDHDYVKVEDRRAAPSEEAAPAAQPQVGVGAFKGWLGRLIRSDHPSLEGMLESAFSAGYLQRCGEQWKCTEYPTLVAEVPAASAQFGSGIESGTKEPNGQAIDQHAETVLKRDRDSGDAQNATMRPGPQDSIPVQQTRKNTLRCSGFGDSNERPVSLSPMEEIVHDLTEQRHAIPICPKCNYQMYDWPNGLFCSKCAHSIPKPDRKHVVRGKERRKIDSPCRKSADPNSQIRTAKTDRRKAVSPAQKKSQDYAAGRLYQFLRMKKERPADPTYWDAHEERNLTEIVAESPAPPVLESAEKLTAEPKDESVQRAYLRSILEVRADEMQTREERQLSLLREYAQHHAEAYSAQENASLQLQVDKLIHCKKCDVTFFADDEMWHEPDGGFVCPVCVRDQEIERLKLQLETKEDGQQILLACQAQAESELAGCKAEIERLKQELKLLDDYRKISQRLTDRVLETESLLRELRPYVEHSVGCQIGQERHPLRCNCGYAALIAKLDKILK